MIWLKANLLDTAKRSQFRKAFVNFVKQGDLFELIDGDTLRIHDKEIL